MLGTLRAVAALLLVHAVLGLLPTLCWELVRSLRGRGLVGPAWFGLTWGVLLLLPPLAWWVARWARRRHREAEGRWGFRVLSLLVLLGCSALWIAGGRAILWPGQPWGLGPFVLATGLLALVLGWWGARWRRLRLGLGALYPLTVALLIAPHLVGESLQAERTPSTDDGLPEEHQALWTDWWGRTEELDAAALATAIEAENLPDPLRWMAEEDLSRRHYAAGDYEAALIVLVASFEREPSVRPSLRHLMASTVLEKLGRLAEAEEHARVAAGARESIDTHFGLMDAGNTDAMAWGQVAVLCHAQGEHWRAFEAWARWHPHSWCGNCHMAMVAQRERELTRSFWRAMTSW